MRSVMSSAVRVLLAATALSGCYADTGDDAGSSEAALTAPASIRTRCEVLRASFVGGGRLALLERGDANGCPSRDEVSAAPIQTLAVGPAVGAPTNRLTEAFGGFDVTPDGQRFIVFSGTRWRVLDAQGAPVGPWRRGPKWTTQGSAHGGGLPQEDSIVRVKVSADGKRVLAFGLNTGITLFAVDSAAELLLVDQRAANGQLFASASFVGADRIVVARRETHSGVVNDASLSMFPIGTSGVPSFLARPLWKVDAPPVLTPGSAITPRPPFGEVSADPAGSLIVVGDATGFDAPSVAKPRPSVARDPEIRDAATGALLRTLPPPVLRGSSASVITFSLNGTRVALSEDRHVRVFETQSGKLVADVGSPDGNLQSGELSPDGKMVVITDLVGVLLPPARRRSGVRFVALP